MSNVRAESRGFERAAGVESEGSAPVACAHGASLVERARSGDAGAFGLLYREHGPMVHAVLLARVERADADDLTQEVFLTAWRRLGDLRDGGAVGGWLASIARSKAADWVRAKGRRRAHESGASRDGVSRDGDAAGARADAVLEAIRSLPEGYREGLLMRLVGGMSGAQIAERLGMTHGSVRVHLHRGMGLLRGKLSEGER